MKFEVLNAAKLRWLSPGLGHMQFHRHLVTNVRRNLLPQFPARLHPGGNTRSFVDCYQCFGGIFRGKILTQR
jgi:hypothetical protein